MLKYLTLAVTLLASGVDSGKSPTEHTATSTGIPASSLSSAFVEDVTGERNRPQLNDFAGLWHGEAIDYPEDGNSTDAVRLKLRVSDSDRLEGYAFGEFVDADQAQIEDVHVTGDRSEFKVRHRTGVMMRVTLGFRGNKLKGEGIPIRSDEDRCDISFERPGKPGRPSDRTRSVDSAGAERLDGRWIGTVKGRSKESDFHRSLIVDVAVDERDRIVQVITMGSFQQAMDDHFDNAKVINGKLVFELVDCEGSVNKIRLWHDPDQPDPDKRDRLHGEALPMDSDVPARAIELTRTKSRRYAGHGGLRRLILDSAQLLDDTGVRQMSPNRYLEEGRPEMSPDRYLKEGRPRRDN